MGGGTAVVLFGVGQDGGGDRRRGCRETRGPGGPEEPEGGVRGGRRGCGGGRNKSRRKPPNARTARTTIQRAEDRRKQKRALPHFAATPGNATEAAGKDMLFLFILASVHIAVLVVSDLGWGRPQFTDWWWVF